MPNQRYKAEQIVTLLRQIEVGIANGKTNTRERLAIRVARRLGSYEVIEVLADVMLWRGVPENIRSDSGPEFVAGELR